MDGLVKKTATEQGSCSTSSAAYNFLFPPTLRYYENEKSRIIITDEDTKLAKDSIEWAKRLLDGSTNDYQYNIGSIAKAGMIDYRLLGYAASIVASYLKETYEKKIKIK